MPAARRIYKVKAPTSVLTKARRAKLPQPVVKSSAGQSTARRLQFSISCSQFGALVDPKTSLSFRQYSSAASSRPLLKATSLYQISCPSNKEVSKRAYATCNAGCPCPFPCGPCGCKAGCGCLPPPCNTPPKCLQYMTGYYYYPYGTWFCGPYHVSGTCAPVGGNCPCPCPVKCCPACVCAPAQNLNTNKNFSDINQFPMEVPCHTAPKLPREVRTGFSKMFNLNAPAAEKKESQPKQKPPSVPPILSTMLCPNAVENLATLMDKEPKIQSSYPLPKYRRYHTKSNIMPADSSYKAPTPYKQKTWKYSYYQTRRMAATPMEKTRIFLKESKNENKNSPRAKLHSFNKTSVSNQKRRDPRPDVDIEIKPYEE